MRLTKSAQEPILVGFIFLIFTLVYGFTYSHWYRSDRWRTHPWALAKFIANVWIELRTFRPTHTHTAIGVQAVQSSPHNFRLLLQTSFRFLQREEWVWPGLLVWRTNVAALLERKQLPVCRLAASLGKNNKTFLRSFTRKMSLHCGKSHGKMFPLINRYPLKSSLESRYSSFNYQAYLLLSKFTWISSACKTEVHWCFP